MRKILFIAISTAICLITISSCQKMHVNVAMLEICVTDKNGNDLLTTANPNSIAEKIIVTYKGKTFKNMHPTDQGAYIPAPWEIGAYIQSDSNPNRMFINTEYYSTGNADDQNQFIWEKGEQISITMPDGTKHTISYVGKDKDPLHRTLWLFDGTEEFYREYTIVYDPEEQK